MSRKLVRTAGGLHGAGGAMVFAIVSTQWHCIPWMPVMLKNSCVPSLSGDYKGMGVALETRGGMGRI